ncbi:MAG TPA: hypothetical protein VND54_00745 [Candidatus Saccharimonadales bacterium]|nr:hypothetical protein [Candidatus Saccharimonadales bacterium]
MKMIARRAPCRSLEPEGLTDGDVRAIGRHEGVEMPIEIRTPVSVKNAERSEAALSLHGVQASDRLAVIAMENAIGDRHHQGFGRTDEVDAGVRMFPRRVAESLTDVQGRAVHRSTDAAICQPGARRRRAAGARCISPDPNQECSTGNKSAAD